MTSYQPRNMILSHFPSTRYTGVEREREIESELISSSFSSYFDHSYRYHKYGFDLQNHGDGDLQLARHLLLLYYVLLHW